MKLRILLPLTALIAFTVWSAWMVGAGSLLVGSHAYLGFLRLAGREPWAAQLLVDVAISCGLCSIWMIGDARSRRIPVAPYLVATVCLGSIGPLAYLVHRGAKPTA